MGNVPVPSKKGVAKIHCRARSVTRCKGNGTLPLLASPHSLSRSLNRKLLLAETLSAGVHANLGGVGIILGEIIGGNLTAMGVNAATILTSLTANKQQTVTAEYTQEAAKGTLKTAAALVDLMTSLIDMAAGALR